MAHILNCQCLPNVYTMNQDISLLQLHMKYHLLVLTTKEIDLPHYLSRNWPLPYSVRSKQLLGGQGRPRIFWATKGRPMIQVALWSPIYPGAVFVRLKVAFSLRKRGLIKPLCEGPDLYADI